MTDTRLSLRGMDRADLMSLGRSLVAQFREDDVPSLAAGVAFRIFLSLFPALFAAVAAFTLVVSGEQMITLLETADFVPAQVRAEIEQPMVRFVDRAGGAATFTVLAGTLGGLWAASSAAVMLSRALTRIYGFAETRRFLTLRLIGVVMAMAIFLALVALVALLVTGGAIQRRLLDTLALTSDFESGLAVTLTVGRVALAVMVLVVLFAFVYWLGPDRVARPRFQWLTPGSFFAVIGWIAVSALFGLYTRVAGENEIYGALGGVIVLLLWLQLTMVILLVGAELNSLLRRFTAARIVRGDDIGGGSTAAVARGQ